MSNLASLLEWIYPDAPAGSWRVQQDSEHDGPYLAAWSVPGVERPTSEYLASRVAEFEALPSDWREKRNKPERHALRSLAARAVEDLDGYLAAADTGTNAERQQRDRAAIKRMAGLLRTVILRLVQID